MSQKVQTLLIDDIDGTAADETVRFGLDGELYEMELTTKHATKLRDGLAKYVAAARPVAAANGHRGPKRGKSGKSGPATVDPAERGRIRAWSLTDAWPGEPAAERGRLAVPLVTAYRAAHPAGQR